MDCEFALTVSAIPFNSVPSSKSAPLLMRNLPERLQGRRYYTPTDQGYEAEVASRLARWWGGRHAGDGEHEEERGGT